MLETKTKTKLNIILYSIITVIACIYLLSRYTNVSSLQIQLIDKEKQISSLKDQQNELRLELEEIKDSGWIEEEAKLRMNMRKAKKNQIIYLDLK